MTGGGRLADVTAAGAALAGGRVVLMPTDTLPGLHARVDRPEAIARIARLKGRPAGKPLLVLAGSVGQARTLLQPLPPRLEAALERCWPGPFSLILPAREGLDAAITSPAGTVAIRVPGVAWVREVALAAGAPLASTSANRAGEPPAEDLDAAVAVFGARTAVYAGEPGSAGTGRPSALIDLTVWPPRLLREGPLAPPNLVDHA